MKLAHVGCLHFDQNRRPDDTRRVAQAFLDGAREAKADLILHGGDASCDQSRPATEAEREMVRWFDEACAEIAPTVRVRGNHDVETDEGLRTRQRTRHPFRLHTRPNFPAQSAGDLIIKTPGGPVGVLALPWFSRAGIASKLPPTASSDEVTHRINQVAAQLLQGAQLAAEEVRAAGAVPVLLHHGTVFEAETSSGWKPLGETVAFTVAQLREVGCEYVALNHFHNRQEWDGGRISYSGSIEPRGFGETEAKGWCLVEIDGERFSNTFIELPARRIVLLDVDWTDDGEKESDEAWARRMLAQYGALENIDGALVRFRYQIRPEDMHLVDRDAIRDELLEVGAHEVTIEPVPKVQARVRCEEIAQAEGLAEEMFAWLEVKGVEVDAEQKERLRLACETLESPAKAGEEVAA